MMIFLEKQEVSSRFGLWERRGGGLTVLHFLASPSAEERTTSKSCMSFVKDITEEGLGMPSSQ